MLLKYRIFSAISVLLLTGMVVTNSAEARGVKLVNTMTSDTVTFSGRAFLAVSPTATRPGFGTLVANTCTLRSDHEMSPFSCKLTATARLTLNGGKLTGSISSRDGVITFSESFVYTGQTTGRGTGTDREFDFDDRNWSSGTVAVSFTSVPSGIANIFDDRGTIVVSDSPNQPGDPDTRSTTTTIPRTTTTGSTSTTVPTTTTTSGTTTTVPGSTTFPHPTTTSTSLVTTTVPEGTTIPCPSTTTALDSTTTIPCQTTTTTPSETTTSPSETTTTLSPCATTTTVPSDTTIPCDTTTTIPGDTTTTTVAPCTTTTSTPGSTTTIPCETTTTTPSETTTSPSETTTTTLFPPCTTTTVPTTNPSPCETTTIPVVPGAARGF